jgi:hypothetical protein
MSKHTAFALPDDQEKADISHKEMLADGLSSLAPTSTRGTDHSESGEVYKREQAKAVRKLLLKLGECDAESRWSGSTDSM